MSKTVETSEGTSILGVLGIVFVVLKLTNTIDWHWALVTLPFWGGLAIVVFNLILYVAMSLTELPTFIKATLYCSCNAVFLYLSFQYLSAL